MIKSYYNIRDSYSLYKELETNPVDIKTYILIINGFMLFLFKKLLEKGEIKLPERLGSLMVIGRKIKARVVDGKIKGVAPDWVETKKLWAENSKAKEAKQLVYHFNEETGGIRYRFAWSKNRVLVLNKAYYQFIATRANKRMLAALIKQGKEYLIKF